MHSARRAERGALGVERWAWSAISREERSTFLSNIKRQLPHLSEMLKAQFGMIADQVMQTSLSSSRGASEQIRVRSLREGVAQVKTALEIAIAHVKERHDLDAAKDDSGSKQ
ncbi:MAG: hypothetical protein DMD26_13285 [Gemmatimonadetes bacterium]|nr:MAG: hypothetical protein DMD26_13285 [Gemmatimonadota bacterium]